MSPEFEKSVPRFAVWGLYTPTFDPILCLHLPNTHCSSDVAGNVVSKFVHTLPYWPRYSTQLLLNIRAAMAVYVLQGGWHSCE